jgi:ABC-type amino acid transport system permease subunit
MLLGAMSIVFFAMRILPGDPCVAMMGDQATTEALADCTKNLGLHRPLAVQYADYIWRSVQLDFGNSLRQGYPVNQYIARMFPHTLVLVLASAIVAVLVGVPVGIISALKRRNPLIDYPLRIFALLGLSMPVFWLGILLLIFFSLRLDLFPLIGAGDLDTVMSMIWSGEVFKYPGDFLAAVGDVLHHLTLPALALGFTLAATVSRLSRSALEALAIVAYRQPVSRPEIDVVRGVNSDAVLESLLDRRLIRIAGRKDAPGRPFLYETTREFLVAFGLRDLSELPAVNGELTLPELAGAAEHGEAQAQQDPGAGGAGVPAGG